MVNTIVREGDQTSKLTERLTDSIFQRQGYESIDPELLKYSGNKAGSCLPQGDSVVVVESKQLSSGGVESVEGNIEGTGLQPQMTLEWVEQKTANLKS